MRTHAPIKLNLGNHKGLIKAHLRTHFGWNSMKIYGVMTDYFHKKRSKVYHAYRVNRRKELLETWHVDGILFVGMPFCGLKVIRNGDMWRRQYKFTWIVIIPLVYPAHTLHITCCPIRKHYMWSHIIIMNSNLIRMQIYMGWTEKL